MSVRHLSSVMQPTSIALIAPAGASPGLCRILLHNLLEGGYRGDLAVVGDDACSTEGVRVCKSAEELPKPPDLALVVSPPEFLPSHVAKLGQLGVKGAIVVTGERDGTGSSEEGLRLQRAVRESCEPFAMRVLGVGSTGIVVPASTLNASLAHVQPLKGKLAFVSQSGAVWSTVLDWATERRIGFSHLISLGSMVDVDFGDMLDYLTDDMNAQAILLHLESLTQVRKFMSAARLASRIKPVIVLKGGRGASGSQSRSEGGTARQLGSDGAYDAAFCRAGMLRVRELRDLFDAFETVARARSLSGDRLAVLSNGRGMGVLAADALTCEGGRLAGPSSESLRQLGLLIPGGCTDGNPVDIRRDAGEERYARALEILLDDPDVDAVLALYCPTAGASGVEIARSVIDMAKRTGVRPRGGRVLTCWLGDGSAADARRLFGEGGISSFETPHDAVRGFMQVFRYRRNQEMLMETPPSIPEEFSPDTARVQAVVDQALQDGRAQLTRIEAGEVLQAYRIPVGETAQSEAACELRVAVETDPQFGPVIRFGYGGAAALLPQGSAAGLPPLNLLLARDLMRRARVCVFPDTVACDLESNVDRVALLLVKVSQLVCDIDRIVALEINPLCWDGRAAWALGARIGIGEAVPPGNARLAIRPYPKELEEVVCLPDGKSFLLRPIRPEDEPAYLALFERLPSEDIFLRFMHPVRTLSHNLAARLTQLDYDREMALVLMTESPGSVPILHGGVRISADPDNACAEFAIVLSRELTGLGLGPLMMRRIIRYARDRGLQEIYGEILSQNTPMLKLCRALGFQTKRMIDDPNVIHATLRL